MNAVNGLRTYSVMGKWKTKRGKTYDEDDCIAWEIDDLACQEGGVTLRKEYDKVNNFDEIKTYLIPVGKAKVIRR